MLSLPKAFHPYSINCVNTLNSILFELYDKNLLFVDFHIAILTKLRA